MHWYITNCASFNNIINYQLPYTFEKWSNNWSWNPIKSDHAKQIKTLITPKDKNTATKAVYAFRNKIFTNFRANKLADVFNFDSVIKGLR